MKVEWEYTVEFDESSLQNFIKHIVAIYATLIEKQTTKRGMEEEKDRRRIKKGGAKIKRIWVKYKVNDDELRIIQYE